MTEAALGFYCLFYNVSAVYIELRGGKAVIREISAYRKFVIKDKDNKMCKK